ncbi:MAG: c-type cytochrome [Caulobacteraceae bacterium]|nr:c-type cytochrome [Caulobacteraceae bacterium]
MSPLRAASACAATILTAMLVGAPASGQPGGHGMMGSSWWGGRGMMGGGWQRHHYAMMAGVPAPYAGYKNPLPKTAATLSRGAAVYAQNCAGCHGEKGHGDGPAAAGLTPRPADLAWVSAMPMGQWDAFMYWTVAEGGGALGTAMPSFKASLPKRDIWSVIAYVQNELPQFGAGGRPYGPRTGRWRCCY